MTSATHYSYEGLGRIGSLSILILLAILISRGRKGLRVRLRGALLAAIAIVPCVQMEAATNTTLTLAERAETELQTRLQQHQASPTNAGFACQFARASFFRAEFPTNTAHRVALAKAGIKACRDVLARETNSAPAHYYLGMNLGQLARTKSLGALPIVDEMEREFKAARSLDELLDFAGPDRWLGVLYLEAPSFASIGDSEKAGTHLKRALKLAPEYPENRLNLIEASVRWGELKNARQELAILEAELDAARKKFSGESWVATWVGWDRRLKRVREKLQ